MAGDWTRTMLGTRSRFLTMVGVVIVLVVVAPILLLILGLIVPAAVSVILGLLCLAAMVLALLPGRRRWR